MPQWKYYWHTQEHHPMFPYQLTLLGKKGWELAAAIVIAEKGELPKYVYYFKRPIKHGLSGLLSRLLRRRQQSR